MASHNSIAPTEISPKNCLKYELEESWCSWSKSHRSSRVNCYSHCPYKKNISLVKIIIIQNKMLSFLELAVSPQGQFKVFSEHISFVLTRPWRGTTILLPTFCSVVLYKKKKSDGHIPEPSAFVQPGQESCWFWMLEWNQDRPRQQSFWTALSILSIIILLFWVETNTEESNALCKSQWCHQSHTNFYEVKKKPPWVFSSVSLL